MSTLPVIVPVYCRHVGGTQAFRDGRLQLSDDAIDDGGYIPAEPRDEPVRVVSVICSRRDRGACDARLHELGEEADERASDDDVHREALVHCEVVCIPA